MSIVNTIEKTYKYCPACAKPLQKKEIEGRQRLWCPACGFIFWSNPRPVVSAIIVKQNAVLLLKRALAPLKEYWCLPGGVIDYEEKPETAVAREVKEETGLDITVEELVGVYQIDNDPRGIALDIIYTGLMRENGVVMLSGEHTEYRFFSLQKLPALIAYKHKKAIADWVDTFLRLGR